MAGELGTTNKNFETELRKFELAFKPGTREYAHRRKYPGEAAAAYRCVDTECLNCPELRLESYWLCPECFKLSPDTIKR